MMTSSNYNWLNSINWQVDFYQRANQRRRTDPEFPWALVDGKNISRVKIIRDRIRHRGKQALHTLGLRRTRPKSPLEWLNSNAEPLWESRSLLHDELSKLLFDTTLVLRLTGHQRFYFPRIDFDDLIEIVDEKPFHNSDLPRDYLGLPLKLFEIRLRTRPTALLMKVVSCNETLIMLNSYRQYLVRRNSVDISPIPGDIVLDCGACIGEISLLFAGLVAMQGEVHLFDPIPLHARYCRLQASLNPSLAHVLHVNELAVGNRTQVTSGSKGDSDKIAPGGLAIDSFASTSLDDYASSKLSRVDFIKMDIEGAEMDAIDGAGKIIREFKPRLAISAYHKAEDLYEIPIKLKSLNPSYELYFGHHSPVGWESVFYAVQR
jgi:FkbM family methyltransferase